MRIITSALVLTLSAAGAPQVHPTDNQPAVDCVTLAFYIATVHDELSAMKVDEDDFDWLWSGEPEPPRDFHRDRASDYLLVQDHLHHAQDLFYETCS
jgi:hypothetical protein